MPRTKTTSELCAPGGAWRPADLRVSSQSAYDDDIWTLDGRSLGFDKKQVTVKWRLPLPGGEVLTASKWRGLLELLKCFVWTLYFERQEGKPLSPASGGMITAGLQDLAFWMVEEGISSFGEITNDRSWEYVSWFVKHHNSIVVDRARGRKVSWSSAHNCLHVLAMAFQQGPALASKGYDAMPDPPYSGRAALNVVERDLRLQRGEILKPIADEIALPALIAAVKWVEHAEDIIRFQEDYFQAVSGAKNSWRKRLATEELLANFRFGSDESTGKPWISLEEKGWSRLDKDGVQRKIIPGIAPRRLVSDLIAACVLVLQGLTGVRSSDVAGLHLDPKATGAEFPSCIKVRKSLDGLTEILMLCSAEQKSTNELHEWVLGARLTGSDLVPPPAKAVMVLDRLLDRYRKLANSDALIISMTNGRGLSLKPESLGPATSNWISDIQRDFIKNYVGLPLTTQSREETSEYGFRAQQWRTTFAHFVLRTNKRALGPLAQHFNHASTVMTELGYIGNDPELRKMMDEIRVNQAAEVLYEAVTDPKGSSGRFSKFIAETSPELREELLTLPAIDAIGRLKGLVLQHDLRLHFTDYGACAVAIRPMVARCHEIAGTMSGSNVRPNVAFREPSICAACQNFLVRRENLEYWEERVAKLEKSKAGQNADEQWVYKRQLAQARQLVRTLREANTHVPGEATSA